MKRRQPAKSAAAHEPGPRQLDTKRWRACAIDPRAFGGWYAGGYTPNEVKDGVAIVSVCGPLDHHQGWWLDSYDAITCRIAEAFADPETSAVVVCFDSPGGDASGVEEAHRAIKRMRAEADKPLYAYSNEACYSAAYWLAAAADEIWLPPTGGVGSIGVIAEAVDVTKANAKAGVRIELVTSGSNKADGHPERPLTSDILGRVQARVDKLASVFFASVAESRDVKPAAIAALQAGTFLGDEAVDVGLADGVAGWDEFLKNVRAAVGLDPGKNRATMEARMAKKLLALTAAVTAAQKALESAKTDEARTTAATQLAAALDAKVKYSKRTRTDEVEEDDGEESEEAPSTQPSSSSPASSDDADSDDAEDEADEDAEEDAEDEADEDAEEDAKKMKSRAVKAMRGRPTTAAAVYDALFALTGKRNLNEAVGALAGIKAALATHEKLAKDVAKLKSASRADKVDAMIERAQRDGRLGKSKAQAEQLRAQGMKDPAFLKGYLASLPKQVRTIEEGHTQPREAGGAPEVAFAALDADSRKMIEVGAQAAGMKLDDYFKAFQAMSTKMGGTGAGSH